MTVQIDARGEALKSILYFVTREEDDALAVTVATYTRLNGGLVLANPDFEGFAGASDASEVEAVLRHGAIAFLTVDGGNIHGDCWRYTFDHEAGIGRISSMARGASSACEPTEPTGIPF